MNASKWILTGSILLGPIFTACQNAENPAHPTDASQPEAGKGSPEEGSAGLVPRPAPEGRRMTESEVAELLKAQGGPARPEAGDFAPPAPSPRELAKTAALVRCNVDFNSSNSLSWIPEEAWHTFVYPPFYIQSCNDGVHWVYTSPKNMDHYHLGYEFQSSYNFCFGSPYKVGMQVGSSCTSLKDARYWPRNASNMQSGSGIEFYAKEGTKGAPLKLFDLKSLRILTGPAIIKVYRTDISSWWQWELAAGTWTFPYNSTKLRYLRIYHKEFNGIFTVDDIVLDVRTN